AVLDTGIKLTHPDLAGKIVVSQNFATGSATSDDLHGHGTHVAGISAAITNNGTGVAGLGRDASLMNVKVMGDTGSGYHSDIANGVIWATDHGANVINMSLGVTGTSTTLQQAVEYAWNHGVVVVAAAGNSGSSVPSYPAYYPRAIAVAASDPNDKLYSFSNFGDWVDVAAPGNALSTTKNGGYGYMSGTSMASPHVAGLAGLVWSVARDNNGDGKLNDDVRAMIENACDNIGVSGIGHGRVNAYKAVMAGSPPPTTNGTITGTVADAATSARISGAAVTDGTRTATTNSSGVYTLSGVPAGIFTVTASASGYTSQSQGVTVSSGATSTANFALSKPVTPPGNTMWVDSAAFAVNGSTLTVKMKVANPNPVTGA
ncbi:MAG: S8 family serine peptidase, partial [Kiritimatiellota bacterium]|nr:S8 family serine peptidase [Kiritimatiellota bacterium]